MTTAEQKADAIAKAELEAERAWVVRSNDAVTVPAWTPADDGVLDEAQSIKAVEDEADYEYAAGLVVRLRAAARAAESYYKPFKQAIDAIKRRVLDREASDSSTYDAEASRVDKMAREWFAAKAARERAAKDAAEQAAREEAERLRQEQVARMERAAAQVPDAAVQEAIKQEAAQIAAAPLATPRSTFQSAIPKVRGYVPTVVTYSAVCDDLSALVVAAAGPIVAHRIREAIRQHPTLSVELVLNMVLTELESSKVPMDAIQANQPRLNKAATDSKEALRWPGVRVIRSEGSRTRG